MMGPVLIPDYRTVQTDRPRMIDWSMKLEPPMGGEVQHVQRLGTRFALDVTIPKMPTEPRGREMAAKLCLAKLYGAKFRFRQDHFDIGVPGNPVADGNLQTGTIINLRGFTPGYAVRLGQACNHIVSGRAYLYFAAAPGVADGEGKLALEIFPMLRKIASDGDLFNFKTPVIEGSLSGNEVAWQRLTAPFCDFGTISIAEDG